MARRIKSQSLSVNTLYSQLTASLELQIQGGVNPSVNKQWYYPNAVSPQSKWQPDYTKTSLFVKPVVTLADPETAQTYNPTTKEVTWIEVKNNSSLIQLSSTSVTTTEAKKSNNFNLLANSSYSIKLEVKARSSSGSVTTAKLVNSSNAVIVSGTVTNTGYITLNVPKQDTAQSGCSIRVSVSAGTSTLGTVIVSESKYFKNNVTEGGTTVYKIAADGTLEMCKNVYPDNPITLFCDVTYTDSRNGSQDRLIESITITASLSADETYSIKLEPEHQYFNPLGAGDNGQRTITASATKGDTDATNDVKFYWYYKHNTGTEQSPVWVEKPISTASSPSASVNEEEVCLAYVSISGTNNNTLTLNADYERENLEIVCRLGQVTTSVQDIPNVYGVATVRWKVPNISGDVFSYNGDTVRQTTKEQKLGVLYRQQGQDVPDATSKARIIKKWYMKKTGTNQVKQLGYGHEMIIKGSDLIDKTGKQAVVSAEGFILSPYKAMIFYAKVESTTGKNPKTEGWYVLSSGNYVKTSHTSPQSGVTYYIRKYVTHNGKLIVGRVIDES